MASKVNIKKSNKYLTVDLTDFSNDEYQRLLHSGSKVGPRRDASQELIYYLCDKYHIPRCPVYVLNTTYDPKFGFTYMGLYEGVKKGITLWNNRHYQVPCDIRTFINTLLHEFMHHYDCYYLRLPDSVHCKGFESRIRDLRKKLQS
jgi:hypothetical protein